MQDFHIAVLMFKVVNQLIKEESLCEIFWHLEYQHERNTRALAANNLIPMVRTTQDEKAIAVYGAKA